MTDDVDDPVTDALVSDSVYERVRVERPALFDRPIPRKLRWQAGLLFALATVLPLLRVVPPGVRSLFPAGDPASTVTKVLAVGLIGGAVTFIAGLWLIAVAVFRERVRGSMTEHRAHTLLSLEEVASALGFVNGGLAIAITLGFHLLGLGGMERIGRYIEVAGLNPFAGVGVAIPASTVTTAAAIGGLLLFAASQYLDLRI